MFDFHSANKWELIAPIPQELLAPEHWELLGYADEISLSHPRSETESSSPFWILGQGALSAQSKGEDVWLGNSQTSETFSFQILTSCHSSASRLRGNLWTALERYLQNLFFSFWQLSRANVTVSEFILYIQWKVLWRCKWNSLSEAKT